MNYSSTPSLSRSEPASPRLFIATDWVAHRALITKLYRNGKTVNDVQQYMLKHHQLNATPRMYKTRFKQWGLRKYFNEQEVLAMCRVKIQRDAKASRQSESLFFCRGKAVDWTKIERYLRENPGTLSKLRDLAVTDPKRPGYIEEILPPNVFVISHRPPRLIRGDKWNEEHERALIALRDHWIPGKSEIVPRVVNRLSLAARLIGSQRTLGRTFERLGISMGLESASRTLAAQVKAGQLWAAFSILMAAADLTSKYGLPELAQQWVSYASELCEVYLPAQHPLAIIVSILSSAMSDTARVWALAQQCFAFQYKVESSVLCHADWDRKVKVISYHAKYASTDTSWAVLELEELAGFENIGRDNAFQILIAALGLCKDRSDRQSLRISSKIDAYIADKAIARPERVSLDSISAA